MKNIYYQFQIVLDYKVKVGLTIVTNYVFKLQHPLPHASVVGLNFNTFITKPLQYISFQFFQLYALFVLSLGLTQIMTISIYLCIFIWFSHSAYNALCAYLPGLPRLQFLFCLSQFTFTFQSHSLLPIGSPIHGL